MEVPAGAAGGLLSSVKPPRIEDAGLEDTALSPDGIQEAFRLAAQKVRSAVFGDDDDEGSPGPCAEAPIPGYTQWEDALVDDAAREQQGREGRSCVDTLAGGLIEEGRDVVVDGRRNGGGVEEDRVVEGEAAGPRLGESGCVKGESSEIPALENLCL
ncbi:uncharacterized protein LOC112344687 [Selaginella moellendorffii]|uniref:uncharacterized protein LOC112344687 n=1 Tax=Selaginella moellendorffii TaxID=88036 RepID=UPI000D1CF18A|nr:uncharacterized protein LOC112344687 [Selaginella moellendorffii]|eukprot:XP_024525718.1 uncharacterized protein LOC112344687 [Selaginella moellendorffii]